MPPRGNEGFDITPILTHYLFLFTSILAVIGWLVAFIGQIAVNIKFAHNSVNVLWFAIFLQLFLIIGVLYTLGTDSAGMNRYQISTFGAVALVFAVNGANNIFADTGSQLAMGAGWLILAIVDILWLLYFTSEEDSLVLHIFNSFGTGGLSPPSRRRRTRNPSVHGIGPAANGYSQPYNSGGAYDAKVGGAGMSMGMSPGAGGISSANSLGPASSDARSMRSMTRPTSGMSGPHSPQANPNESMGSPLMGGNAGIGAGGGMTPTPSAGVGDRDRETSGTSDTFLHTAKALYAYTASPDDPNEISFAKGEILDVMDKTGKWWQARKADGRVGIAPSNYLQII